MDRSIIIDGLEIFVMEEIADEIIRRNRNSTYEIYVRVTSNGELQFKAGVAGTWTAPIGRWEIRPEE